LF
ncbi:hypothetical protein D030_3121B, partial [Vibrio parahaemolyticus AQ3810]|jgi:hypothetical protein